MKLKRFFIPTIILIAFIFILSSCTTNVDDTNDAKTTAKVTNNTSNELGFSIIKADRAKELMDSNEEYFLLDVRTQYEFDEAHIEGAVLIPYTEIEEKKESLPIDKDTLILIYCRTGRRSNIAAKTLVSLGYTNIYDFGGITAWPFETVSNQ